MLIQLFHSFLNHAEIAGLGVIAAWLLTMVVLKKEFRFLPRDHGRAFAINGELSKGKIRGVGLLISLCFVIVTLLFLEITGEILVFCLMFLCVMLSGYLDDASQVPWSDYKKGLIDLIIAVVYMISFIRYNSTDIVILNQTISVNPYLYAVLGVILIWGSINVTNCSDGVDGLCATLSIISLSAYSLIFPEALGSLGYMAFLLIGCVLAYLYYNVSPSTMLMGDAGSRALGFFLAVLAMKSGHPLSFLLLAAVLIIDGGLGLVKIFLLRFLKISVLKNTRTPIHDEMRKNRGWSDPQVVFRFAVLQIILCVVLYLLV